MQKGVKHYHESTPVHILFGLKRAIKQALNDEHKVSLLLEYLHSANHRL